MKKIICLIISAIMVVGIFTTMSLSSIAAGKKVSLKKSSATLKINKINGKTVYGSTTIKLKKAKGVTVKKVAYKSSSKKIATVTSKGKVKSKKKGNTKITVKVKYKYKKHTYTKSLPFKVTVKDLRTVAPKPTQPATEPTATQSVTETTLETTPTSATETQQTESTEPPTEPSDYSQKTKKLNEVNTPVNSSYNFENKEFLKKLSKFSNKLYSLSSKNEQNNYTMSPVSVYMALSMLYSIGDDGVKSDIRELTGMQDSDFAETGKLFKYLSRENKYYGDVISRLTLTNSIWINNGIPTNQDVLDSLASDYYCNAFETPFQKNNAEANKAIREFIKEQTNGMIDQDFDITPDTLFALINTLYFKDVWSTEFTELPTQQKVFNASNKNETCEFLVSQYLEGNIQETDDSYYFYTTTDSGYKLKLVLPKDGHTLKEAMSAANLNKINTDAEFNKVDPDGTEHFTRCIFPSFRVESSTPLKEILQNNNYLLNAFCFYTSPLVAEPLQVSDIKHKVVVDVSKTGIEGAAVTIVISKAGTAYDPNPTVYHDFVLDKNFGFIITDRSDVVLFEGEITKPNK